MKVTLTNKLHRAFALTAVTRLATVAAFLLSVAPKLAAADWPQWRGPNRDGISRENGLLKTWPASGPFVAVVRGCDEQPKAF
jgi:hypothetical protein